MSVSITNIRHQLPVLASLGEAVASGIWRSVAGGPKKVPDTPGPENRVTIDPISPELVREFVAGIGGDPAVWRGLVPPHLFPQWCFPLSVQAFREVPWPLWRALNAGAAMRVNAPLALGEPFDLVGRLEHVEADERRVILTTRITTRTSAHPEALVAHFSAFVPFRSGRGPRKEPELVPEGARELQRWKLDSRTGLDFALLTGDFNPIHWVGPWARLSGFPNVILHGFGSMARAAEGLVRGAFGGDGTRLAALDVRFVKPLVLPRDVGLYVDGGRVWIADGRGTPAYLSGTFEGRGPDGGGS